MEEKNSGMFQILSIKDGYETAEIIEFYGVPVRKLTLILG